jgi:predicted DNA-binding transcriptional regulator AlpA
MYEQTDLRERLRDQLAKAQADAADGLAIWREREVLRRTGLSRATRWRWERAGKFPRRVPLGSNASGYLAAEVIAWMQAMLDRRDQGRK